MIVIDASIAVKWCVAEPGSAEAEALIDEETSRAAPEHMMLEVAQALLRHVQAGRIPLGHVTRSLQKLRTLVKDVPTPWLLDDAVAIAAACRCSVYDALNVAAADRWDCHLVTADAKLRGKLAGSVWARRVLLLRVPPDADVFQGAP